MAGNPKEDKVENSSPSRAHSAWTNSSQSAPPPWLTSIPCRGPCHITALRKPKTSFACIQTRIVTGHQSFAL